MMKTLLAAVIALSGSGVHAGIVDTVKLAMNNQPPKTPFARQTPPAALDYARPSSWAA